MQALQLHDIEESRPNRLNYAGWCIYCDERNCRNPRCIGVHARSVWAVCDLCDGSEYVDWESTCMERCTCTGGLREVTSAGKALSLVPDVAARVEGGSSVPAPFVTTVSGIRYYAGH